MTKNPKRTKKQLRTAIQRWMHKAMNRKRLWLKAAKAARAWRTQSEFNHAETEAALAERDAVQETLSTLEGQLAMGQGGPSACEKCQDRERVAVDRALAAEAKLAGFDDSLKAHEQVNRNLVEAKDALMASEGQRRILEDEVATLRSQIEAATLDLAATRAALQRETEAKASAEARGKVLLARCSDAEARETALARGSLR